MKSLFGGPVRGHVQVEMLSAYLDGQASPAERAYVDAHLQECGACRAELDSLRRTVALLQALPRVAVPRAFTLSEAQVGIRRPQPSPGWIGGLVRGLGAVAAVVLVAFVAVSILRPEQVPWNPSQTVARVAAPTTAPAAQTADQATAPTVAGAAAPEAAPAPAAQEAPFAESAAPAATVASAPETTTLAAAPSPEPEQPAALAAEAAPTEATTDMAAAAPAPEATATAAEPPMVAKAAPSPEPEMGAAAIGIGGGGRDAGGAGIGGGDAGVPVVPSEYLTPEPTPPGAPLATSLPSGLRFAYADLNSLWAVDRDSGARQLAQGRGINTPQLSPDQQWVAYRMFTDKGLQLWAVRWEGGEPKLLLDDASLPTDRLPAGYTRRAFNDSRWGPGSKILSVTLSLVPDPAKPLLPLLELWQLNVESGELKFSNQLGRAWRPFYSPDGKQYVTIANGTDEKPEGAVTLYETATGKALSTIAFPAGPGKVAYESQVGWMPNSAFAWIAIPTWDDTQPGPGNGTDLYRLSSAGAETAGKLDAFQVFWSPDAKKMAYTRYMPEDMSKNELYLANADSSDPRLYATMTDGQFISWSPTGKRFLYQDNYQVFVGEEGKDPVRLTNAVSTVGPKWISDDKVLALHDTGDGWLLVMRDVDGTAVGLLPLPRDAVWDAGTRL